MPADDLYVLSSDGDEDGEWVSPRPVVEAVAAATDLSTDDLDGLDAYVDRERLAAHLRGGPADEPLTFTVEGHRVAVEPDGTVTVRE